jgi:hypothetical protein
VWQLVSNVTIGGTNCSWSRQIVVDGPTTLLGEAGASNRPGSSSQSYPLPAALSPTSGVGRGAAAAQANTTGQAAGHGSGLQDGNSGSIPNMAQAAMAGTGHNSSFVLNFQHTADLIHLPPDAADNYFQIRNITLGQLSQAGSLRKGGWSTRGLLQTGKASDLQTVSLSDTHLGLFTIMLWPFNRCVLLQCCVTRTPSQPGATSD